MIKKNWHVVISFVNEFIRFSLSLSLAKGSHLVWICGKGQAILSRLTTTCCKVSYLSLSKSYKHEADILKLFLLYLVICYFLLCTQVLNPILEYNGVCYFPLDSTVLLYVDSPFVWLSTCLRNIYTLAILIIKILILLHIHMLNVVTRLDFSWRKNAFL